MTPFLITPSDTADSSTPEGIATAIRAISFATAGDLAVETATGQTVIIPNGALAAGQIHRLSVRRILATGTDADGIVGYA